MLALTPLLPAMSHWQLYSGSGVCVPLPVSTLHRSAAGHAFTVGIMTVVSGLILVMVLAGYTLITNNLPSKYKSVVMSTGNARKTSQSCDGGLKDPSTRVLVSRSTEQLSKTRCLLPMMVGNMLLWLPVSVWIVLQQWAGWLRMSDPSTVTLLLVTLPLRSALNPLLLWLGVVREQRRQEQTTRLIKWMGV